MFRVLSIFIIIISFVWLFIFLKKNKISFSEIFNNYFEAVKRSFAGIRRTNSESFDSKINWMKYFFYLTTIIFFSLMVLSAFLNVIFIGDDLTGLFLLVHVTVAPLFSIFLAITIILFAQSNTFNKNDFTVSIEGKNKLNKNGYPKIIFWLIVFFSIPIMVSIILSMFPLFGTEGQIFLLNIHRYSTLIIFILFIFHIALVSTNFDETINISQ